MKLNPVSGVAGVREDARARDRPRAGARDEAELASPAKLGAAASLSKRFYKLSVAIS